MTAPNLKKLAKELQIIRDQADKALAEISAATEADVTPARRAAAAVAPTDKLPFRSFSKIASGKRTQSRKILAGRTVDELQAALAYEKAHSNRSVVIGMIETQLRKKQPTAAAPTPVAPAPEAAAPADKLPFRSFSKVASGKRTESKKILAGRTVDELQAALAYEKAHANRSVVIGMIETQLRKKQRAGVPAAPAELMKPTVPAGALPFAGYDKVASSRQTESRKILAARTADELQAALAFEQANANRRQIIGMIETQLAKKQEQADPLPFPKYDQVASSRRTESRHLLAKQDADTLTRTLAYEKAHANRRQVIALIEGELSKKQPAAAPARPSARRVAEAGNLPFAEYARVASSRQTESRKILAARTADELQAALAFEQANANRRQIIGMIETQLRKKEGKVTTGRASDLPSDIDMPFPGYERVASSRQTESRHLLAAQDIPTLQKTLEFEQAHANRRQVITLIENAIRKQQAGGTPTPARRTATAAVATTAQGDMPFPGYERVASSRQTESRHLLADQDVPTLEKTLEFEKAHANRRQVIGLIEAALRKKQGLGLRRAGEVPEGVEMPFPGYEQVASSRQTESRHLLNAQDVPTLQKTLEFEQEHQNRRQVITLIENAIRKHTGQPVTASRTAAAAPPAAPEDLPFPEYADVASSRRTQSRAILIGQTAEKLRDALEFEKAHGNRRQVIALIENVIRQKESGSVRGSAKTASEPVKGYDSLPTSMIMQSIADGVFDTRLEQALSWERTHQNRTQIIEALQQRFSGSGDNPIISPSGRQWAGKEPFRGYGSMDHHDTEALRAALKDRSSAELRRVEAAERRQTFPSQQAIDIAAEVLEERSGQRQPVAA